MTKEEIATFIEINSEIDKFVKKQKDLIASFKSVAENFDNIYQAKKHYENLSICLYHNLDLLITNKNKILGLSREVKKYE